MWKENRGSRAKEGAIAGSLNLSHGYVDIVFNKKRYSAHRLAFFYMTGEFPQHHTDHINGKRSDNRWSNLRAVTAMENHHNQKMKKNNKSGVNGVCWLRKIDKWQAQIRVNYKTIHLGTFENKEDAVTARKEAEKNYGFHSNHGRKH